MLFIHTNRTTYRREFKVAMTIDVIIEFLNRNLINGQDRPLNSSEMTVLRGIWQYSTYKQIALDAGYSPDYFTNVVAPELFKRLSKLIGQRVTKRTCRALIETYVTANRSPNTAQSASKTVPSQRRLSTDRAATFLPIQKESSPRYPNGSLPIDSPYYIERAPLEELAYEEISKPGALVRIKAPQEMGKTSLMLRILEHATNQGYRTASLDLQQIDEDILNNLHRFLRWLCANVSYQLNLESKLDDYWDEDIGAKVSCTLYFQDYLLANVDGPLVLALDEVNQLFEHPQVAKDVLPLLRSWYEEAKRLSHWKKLRLVVIHSTEIYVPLQLKQSPFNVGLPVQLEGFSLEQIQQLATSYGVDRNEKKQVAQQLMDIVGGHPALIHITLYYLSRGEITLKELSNQSEEISSIYNYHLQRHWARLEEQPELLLALTTVIESSEPVSLEPIIAYKLSSMGLIKRLGNQVSPGCELYRLSFTQR